MNRDDNRAEQKCSHIFLQGWKYFNQGYQRRIQDLGGGGGQEIFRWDNGDSKKCTEGGLGSPQEILETEAL